MSQGLRRTLDRVWSRNKALWLQPVKVLSGPETPRHTQTLSDRNQFVSRHGAAGLLWGQLSVWRSGRDALTLKEVSKFDSVQGRAGAELQLTVLSSKVKQHLHR